MSDVDEFEYKKAQRELHECMNELRKMEGKEPIPWVEQEPPYCSFCGKGKNEVEKTIESTDAAICNTCVAMSIDIINSHNQDSQNKGKAIPSKNVVCTFCGKSSSDVKRMIQGPSVFICNECVTQSAKILQEGSSDESKNT